MKRLIQTWISGITVKQKVSRKEVRNNLGRCISASNLKRVNERLNQLSAFCPAEFQRAPRAMSMLAFWRAHEYRQFLLYLGPSVLHDILPENEYTHLLTLQMYTRLLADSERVKNRAVIDFAKKLAELFITTACEIFGDHWCSYNIHGLMHVPEDVFKFGCLEKASCFKFENFLYILKKMVRSGREPLKQAINRYVV